MPAAPATAAGAVVQETKAHGKGKVRPRAVPGREVGAALLPRLAAVSHADAEHGEREGDPRPRFGEDQAAGWVDYVTLDGPAPLYAALGRMREARPVLLRGSPLVAGLVGVWGFDRLGAAFGGRPGAPLRVLCSDGRRRRFFECDAAKNVYGGPYHVREPETQRLDMTFAEFAACARRWRGRRLLLRAPARPAPPGDAAAAAAAAPTAGLDAAAAYGPAVAADLAARVDWAWLRGLAAAQRHGAAARLDLEAGGAADGLQPARYAPLDALLAVVAGRRRVLLLPPGAAFEGAYPYPVHHPYDGYSMVDWEAVDAGRWPRARGVRGLTAVVGPGDVLFVPAYWFAHEHDLEGETLALRFSLAPGARPPPADAAPLRLSRSFEARAADAEGVPAVRRWLAAIGRGREGEAADLATVAGYRRVVLAQALRDDADAALGRGAWARLLPAICEGRLAPTPWLNADFREPLYLTDTPVVLEDTRTEEERRFPQLFRRKLQAEGWEVPASVSTVPIPGVNMPKDADYRTL